MSGNGNEGAIAVIGAGPIGGIMAAHLRAAGANVALVDILRGHLDAIGRDGLVIEGVKDMTVSFPEEALLYDIGEMGGRGFDTVFISVKASVLGRILPALEKVCAPGTLYVSLQNGLDTEEVIAGTFGDDNVVRMVINYAGNLAGDGRITMNFFNPPNHLGGMTPASEERARALAAIIDGSGLATECCGDIKRHEWEKVILNLALAGPCALTGKTMRTMMDLPQTRELARELMREGIAVAAACGVTYGDGFLDKCMEWVDRTGYHVPSMAIDIREGRPTEIDFLHGKVVEHGRAKGVPAPANAAVTALVKGREAPERKPDRAAGTITTEP